MQRQERQQRRIVDKRFLSNVYMNNVIDLDEHEHASSDHSGRSVKNFESKKSLGFQVPDRVLSSV